ncbi:rhoptry protein ROP9 [Toxoplasma gondii GAB2-2007-GAL-DOM2]|uniref:Rhoptry protein ROP9 n=9 Tax=Toxoplasma gondii TaxID=5811 RepID=A0A125YHP1_TOXGV|nr:rhoptry protein ROP9 [Toxoplasma gondii GT1]ESS31661.1 rhoptry protein ROP9 [Toxoplasma gondii VEG]KAF4643201.1 rhoptry protein ROP9 [Toxoplasma gondii]KFG33140.1 rhoptry protein ROP9 [Toxoplasma gondii GAB2-2007-GAL-DOM2]KFG51461.1 rhoptry protein ROP9 [Toxoplasma gondii FOU]KFH04745.1 rhoptry protein ROP9 [Toxoplasma gondii VAND]PUA87298.1 rhoptry protein ROP9 [Toxoplasma gondii TgCATBr9]RQX69158.1 rhoptry protein ROP9 [Toxoplasma gondii CAST]
MTHPNPLQTRFSRSASLVSRMPLVRLFFTIAAPLLFSPSPFPFLPLKTHCLAIQLGKPQGSPPASQKEAIRDTGVSHQKGEPSDSSSEPKPQGTVAETPGAASAAAAEVGRPSRSSAGPGKKKRGPSLFTEETMGPSKRHPCLKTLAAAVERFQAQHLTGRDAAKAFVDAIQECGIQVVASDYDRTAISVHSGGSARRDDLSVLGALTPDFKLLGEELTRRNIPIYFVTFSDKGENRGDRIAAGPLVEATLKASNANFEAQGVFGYYPPFYSEPEDYAPLGLSAPMPTDKSFHIQQVSKASGVSEDKILLLDDDRANCVNFCRSGGAAIHVSGHEGFDFGAVRVVVKPSLIMQ